MLRSAVRSAVIFGPTQVDTFFNIIHQLQCAAQEGTITYYIRPSVPTYVCLKLFCTKEAITDMNAI